MDTTPVVSNEQLLVNHSSLLGVELLGVVESTRTKVKESGGPVVNSDLEAIAKIIQKHTKLNMSTFLINGMDAVSVVVDDPVGHSGVSGDLQHHGVLSGKFTSYQDKLMRGTIDLKKVQVGGSFTDVEFILNIGDERLTSDDYTVEEVTASILHEVGHAFWSLATIGEYVWMNYFLTDGIDVLLKKKPNQYRVEILDAGYLEKHVTDPALRQTMTAQPTEAQLRRAVLDVKYNYARGHLHSVSNPGSFKRHEQMADWFAARMGFAKPMATLLHKLQRKYRNYKRYYRSPAKFVGVEVAKVLFGTAPLAFASGPMMAVAGLFAVTAFIGAGEFSGMGEYDNPTERIRKLRMELVAQLKDASTDRRQMLKLQDDIKVVDGLLDGMNQYPTLFEMLTVVVNRNARRKSQLLKQEQELESLLNNDLFVHASRFR